MSDSNNDDTSKKGEEREVTDPVTHLPLLIHDNTSFELHQVSYPSSNSPVGQMDAVVRNELRHRRWQYSDSQGKRKSRAFMTSAVAAGAGGAASLALSWIFRTFVSSSEVLNLVLGGATCCVIGLVAGGAVLHYGGQEEEQSSIDDDDDRTRPEPLAGPETAAWLNSFLASLWPIVNPALFTSVSDMLEDALQATLPKLVHGVRVADIGQGTEPLRILGVRSLSANETSGTKPEDGDFVNLELAVAYKARSVGQDAGLTGRSRNAHLLMEFYLSGGIVLPVWVELTGLVAKMRLRVQLMPNPPFLSLMTLTLLGQPKVEIHCTPLAQNFLNIMDIPGLSGWLQSAIDMAVGQYVAPRSLNLDLKTLLTGKEKMDTDAIGAVIVTLKSAQGFRNGDEGKFWLSKKQKQGDPYVSVGWGKWGKPFCSTRIIENESRPVWEETMMLLVTPAEIHARERLRLQLWDSGRSLVFLQQLSVTDPIPDRFSADDILGTVEISLHDIIETSNQSRSRQDDLVASDGSKWPGVLHWSVGYFSKTDVAATTETVIQEDENAHAAMPERDTQSAEMREQKQKDLKEKEDEIIASTKPSDEWLSGILSVSIEQITELGVQKKRKDSDLPSPYCTVIVNHQRMYKTRTKMKTKKPYFNASTERFIKNWFDATVIIAARDARVHETDPLLGVVVLPLQKIFKHRSQVTDSFPLVGGIGYGRVRLSLAFRSVQAKLPRELLGWDLCTLEIQPSVKTSANFPADLASCKLIVQTPYGRRKMYPHPDGGWKTKIESRSVRLAVKNRYASCLLVQFQKRALGPDVIPAFSTLWLKDIPDGEELAVTLTVRKNVNDALTRARFNATTDIGEPIGSIDVKVKLWPGLSGYHQYMADKDASLAEVMEVLDCAEESHDDIQRDVLYESDSSVSSVSSTSGSSDGTIDGVKNQFKDYRKRKGELHRKHRGLMQWKGVRNIAWLGRSVENKADKLEHKLKGKLKHQQKEMGIEREV
ncbi:uncharacterized protein EV420DRAFT_1619590 [Desarmillaria tabescens]|uniref:Meiotically up-regulated gene 190 protein n=1 Tax=Armillaria tabescens TaxID=1929756 RepID=A0AA39N8R6_ARMTA|nr:uncharacterized protein EV420DRAFT_1619590 [Desarmillaria tabescens]KAK0461108.1 hypothetical protein EV420DRAFT_1619590 [Desarmillaria tabescens]